MYAWEEINEDLFVLWNHYPDIFKSMIEICTIQES